MQDSVIYQHIKAQGVQEGLKQGKVNLVLYLLKIRLGEMQLEDDAHINALSLEHRIKTITHSTRLNLSIHVLFYHGMKRVQCDTFYLINLY